MIKIKINEPQKVTKELLPEEIPSGIAFRATVVGGYFDGETHVFVKTQFDIFRLSGLRDTQRPLALKFLATEYPYKIEPSDKNFQVKFKDFEELDLTLVVE